MHTTDIVIMAGAIADKLDSYISSPLDAVIAISQVHAELPVLHAHRRRLWFGWIRPCWLKVYRARIDWLGLGIDYVEHGGNLHVIDAWTERDRVCRLVDCVFTYPADDSKHLILHEGA